MQQKQAISSNNESEDKQVDRGAALSARNAVVGVDEEFGSQTCRSTDATKPKTDVNSRVGDEDADGRNATLCLPNDGQAVNVPR